MHLYAAWQFGIESPEAVDLAHKFCQCMDASKTGLTIKPEVRKADSAKFMGDLPEWAYDTQDEGKTYDWSQVEEFKNRTAIKNEAKPESVLCALWDEGRKEVGWLKKTLSDMSQRLRGAEDTAVSDYWRTAVTEGWIDSETVQAIRAHLRVMEDTFARTNSKTRQTIEAKTRERMRTGGTVKKDANGKGSMSKGMPLRRVRSEATQSLSNHSQATDSGSLISTARSFAADDLTGGDMQHGLEASIEVPTILGSASEVASRFCQWPSPIKERIAKMDPVLVERLELLRASYAYSITYNSRPKFAFEMAWRWVLHLKRKRPAILEGMAIVYGFRKYTVAQLFSGCARFA